MDAPGVRELNPGGPRPTGVRWGGSLGAGLRIIAGAIVAGALGGCLWCAVFAVGTSRHWSSHDYVRAAGLIVDHAASRDTTRGYLWTALALALLALVLTAGSRWLPRRTGQAGLLVSGVLFVAWGLVFSPIASGRAHETILGQRLDVPAGWLGLDGGEATPFLGVIAAVATGFLVLRVVRLTADAGWWRPGRALMEPVPGFPSLELREERPEEGDVRSPR